MHGGLNSWGEESTLPVEVTRFETGIQALLTWERSGRAYDCIIAADVLPMLDLEEFTNAAARFHPGVPIIVAEEPSPLYARQQACHDRFVKPLSAGDLYRICKMTGFLTTACKAA
jgi:CheY-like chemotaxis protein